MHSLSSQFSPKNPTPGRAIHSNSSPAEKAGCGVSVTIPNAVHSRHYIYTIQFTHQKIHACLPLAGQSAARQAPWQHTIKKSAPIRLTRSIRVPFQHPTKKSAQIRHIRAPPRGVRASLPPGRFLFPVHWNSNPNIVFLKKLLLIVILNSCFWNLNHVIMSFVCNLFRRILFLWIQNQHFQKRFFRICFQFCR